MKKIVYSMFTLVTTSLFSGPAKPEARPKHSQLAQKERQQLLSKTKPTRLTIIRNGQTRGFSSITGIENTYTTSYLSGLFYTMRKALKFVQPDETSEHLRKVSEHLREITKKAADAPSFQKNIKELLFRSIYITIIMDLDHEDASVASADDVYRKPIQKLWPKNWSRDDFKRWANNTRRISSHLLTTGSTIYHDIYSPVPNHDRINQDLGIYPHLELAHSSLSCLVDLTKLTSLKIYHGIIAYLTRFFYNFYPILTTSAERLDVLNSATANAVAHIDEQLVRKLLQTCWQSVSGLFNLITHTYPEENEPQRLKRMTERMIKTLELAKKMLPSELYKELESEINRLSKIY